MSQLLRGIGMTSQRTRDRLVQRLREEGIKNPAVLEVMREVPRHIFVDEALASRAYEDTALPIGHGQTISQPYIVARMTEILLAEGVPEKVLEVGTGSGYQTAVLARLVPQVYTVERIEAFLRPARERFRMLGLRNIRLKHSDGSWGWPEHGPYPAILVTAAPEEIPAALLEQLAPGGRLVIPVGPRGKQTLALITRGAEGYERVDIERVSFVPLLGGTG
ncbi:MAG: protein-L-isoaspartate(D-aspartate) O-methyltransferase [Gammaproteobacteria bacterium]